MSKFSGAVQCDTLLSNSVVSASYNPGAGNVRQLRRRSATARRRYFVAAAQSPMRLPVNVMFIVPLVCFIVMRIWPS